MPTMTIIEWKKIQCHILIVSGKEIDRVDYQITIYSASANFSIDNPSFGAVESASIQLRGRLGPAECTYIKEPPHAGNGQWIFNKRSDSGTEGELCGIFSLDALEVEFANQNAGPQLPFLFFSSKSSARPRKASYSGTFRVPDSQGLRYLSCLVGPQKGSPGKSK